MLNDTLFYCCLESIEQIQKNEINIEFSINSLFNDIFYFIKKNEKLVRTKP